MLVYDIYPQFRLRWITPRLGKPDEGHARRSRSYLAKLNHAAEGLRIAGKERGGGVAVS